MWTSDVREMINMFAEMVLLEENLNKSDFSISPKIQDKVYKDSCGQFISLLGAAINPSEDALVKESVHIYGKHLSEIVEAFHQIASFELKNKQSKNLDKNTIKKARRIEITNLDKILEKEAIDYYNGLVRYGIFIQDYRGKSVRGKVAPRLYLRSRLIPFYRLTFSKRDSITMSCDDLEKWLLDPKKFVEYYMKRNNYETGQKELFEEKKFQ